MDKKINLKLYTAQYRYAGNDRLDITVKGKDPVGKVFSPTWRMVMGSKEGRISWDEYSVLYRNLMRESYQKHLDTWNNLLSRDEVTLVCFCKLGDPCHRYLLADYLVKLGADYFGERIV